MSNRARLLVILAVASTGGCAAGSYGLSGGPTYNRSHAINAGDPSGVGAGAELSWYRNVGERGWGVAISADHSGVYQEADGDGVIWAEAGPRYRWFLGGPDAVVAPFVSGGVGVGYTLCCYISDGVASGLFEAGAELRLHDRAAVAVGVRERPAVIGGEFHNTLQVVLTVSYLQRPRAGQGALAK